MRILFVSANPHWTARLDIGNEMRDLQKSLKGRDVRLMMLPAAQIADLQVAVESNDIDIIHFSGHATEEDGLQFTNSDGMVEPVDPDYLRELFTGKGIKLAVLNACDTQATAKKIADSVGMVIGTTEELDDKDARKMTKALYASLVNGSSPNEAYEKAIKVIAKRVPLSDGTTHVEDTAYIRAGKHGDTPLFSDDALFEGDVSIEGQGPWDRHFYATYLDDQIQSLRRDIQRNRRWFVVLLVAGLAFLAVFLWLPHSMNFREAVLAVNKNWGNIVGGSLLDWLVRFGSAIPALFALLQARLMVHGNERLRALEQLKDMVRSSEDMTSDMSLAVQNTLHKILEQSLRGAIAE